MEEVKSEWQAERRMQDTGSEDREMSERHSLKANECSPRAAWIFGQYKKPFSDGGVIKECMSAVDENLLEGKQKKKSCFSKIAFFILRCKSF